MKDNRPTTMRGTGPTSPPILMVKDAKTGIWVSPRDQFVVKNKEYEIGRKKYRRMTEVLSLNPVPWLDRWKRKVGEEEAAKITAETSQFGDVLHYALELNDLDRNRELDELMRKWRKWDIEAYVASWNNWVEVAVKRWVGIEIIVTDEQWGVAGRMDRVAIINGDSDYTLVDIKSGRLHPEIGKQLYGYKRMWNGGAGKRKGMRPIDRTMAIGLHRDGKSELIPKVYDSDKWKGEVEGIVGNYNELILR